MNIFRRVGSWIRNALTIDWAPLSEVRRIWDFGSNGFGSKVGQGESANVIMSPVGWIVRTFTQGTPVVEQRRRGKWVRPMSAADHAVVELLQRPNRYYNGDVLHSGLLVSYFLDGNGYLRKVRSDFREPVELWYVPHFLIKPKWPDDGSVFISHYEYTPPQSGVPEKIPVSDIVHVRYGLDPFNPRLGLAPLKTVIREAFTDEEASSFAAFILGNMGVPGGVISPAPGSTVMPSGDEIDELKRYMEEEFTGKKRGRWLVTGKPTSISQFGFDPNNLQLGPLRDISEERVCAALGTPAAVVGFGAGLQQTKVGATMRELVKLGRVNCIEPAQSTIGRQLGDSLLPDFETRPRTKRIVYDNTGVGMFQEDETEVAKRATNLYKSGVAKRNEARTMVGLELDDEDGDSYYQESSSSESGADGVVPPDGVTDNGDEEGVDPPVPPAANRIAFAELAHKNGDG